MTTHNPLSEQDLEDAFKDDPEFGIRLLYEDYRETILRYIKSKARALQLADWLDIYQDTMKTLYEKTQEPGFDHRRPLALVFRIAQFKAIDAYRRKKIRANPDTDAIIDHVAEDFRDSKIGMEWRLLDSLEQAEFRQALDEIIPTLPERQRIAAQVFVNNYEDLRARNTYRPLAEEMSKVVCEEVSVVAAKSAWHEAKKKIVRELASRGFKFLETE